MLDQQLMQQRGAAIIEGTQEMFRQDGYSNMLNRYGTKQDNSTAYQYNQENITDDMELVRLYEGNGLFTKIIDRPSEEAVKHGLDIDFGDEDISEYVDDRLDVLEFEDKFATAEKWARLYGGSIIVMLVDDGRGLEEPLDWNNVRSIEELRVFERAVVQPDYTSLYSSRFSDTLGTGRKFGEPEYYHVNSIYGYFTVHRSRCLVFRNGRLPEQTTSALYRYWGIPEYVKIKRALRECVTSHENGVKLLERCVQAIYKMKNLANMLSTADGEDKVLQRLQVIDMARSILNSIAIDTDGEEYAFESITMAGVKDVLDSTCNMLSAVTDIPQTILFGRSPAGMNSTGENDMENYYNMVENIQKQNMKANTRTVVDLVLRQGKREGRFPQLPKYKVKFAALWSMSDTEKADMDKKKADTEYTKAQTAQVYMESNVLDPSEVRKSLAREGDFDIEEVITQNYLDLPDDTFETGVQTSPDAGAPTEMISISEAAGKTDAEENAISVHGIDGEWKEAIHLSDMDAQKDEDNMRIHIISHNDGGSGSGGWEKEEGFGNNGAHADGADYPAAAVIILHNGRILCASRNDLEGICGPGGKVEAGESTEEAAVREAVEEFHIVPLNLLPVGGYKGSTGLYQPCMVYFTDQFYGTPEADGDEMTDARWLTLQEMQKEQMFPPFEESVKMLINLLTGANAGATITSEMDGGPGSGNFGHGGRPGKTGGSLPKSSSEAINNAIKEGRISTKLDTAKQSKHTKGSARYNKAIARGDHVSTIDLSDKDIQKIIDSNSGKGTAYSNGIQFKETIDAEKKVGTYVDAVGNEAETSRLTIHYSSTGCHAVPARPKK